MSGTRWVSSPGCVNLRDVGGYLTKRGDALAWGRLYRGARLPPKEFDGAASVFEVTGVRRVIDLRVEEEVAAVGAPAIPADCRWLRMPLFTLIRPEWQDPPDRRPRATAVRYLEMAEVGAPVISQVVALLKDAATCPTLIHCAVGRDRTGIVIACLLDLLDVAEETIAADYALSEVVDDAGAGNADPETIVLLLRMIREKYGSTQGMLQQARLPRHAVDLLRVALVSTSGGQAATAGGPNPAAQGTEPPAR
jgi:protein-tyrosine phosphatase